LSDLDNNEIGHMSAQEISASLAALQLQIAPLVETNIPARMDSLSTSLKVLEENLAKREKIEVQPGTLKSFG
jgi:hypothetical protein